MVLCESHFVNSAHQHLLLFLCGFIENAADFMGDSFKSASE